MARFYISTDNSRGGSVTACNPTYAHIRGWSAGVHVNVWREDDTDRFDIRMTSGSNGGGTEQPIGTVRSGESGPVFSPAGQHTKLEKTIKKCQESGIWVGPDCRATHYPESI